MKNYCLLCCALAIVTLTFFSGPSSSVVRAQDEKGKMLATIEFDPETDGFGFKNPGNDHIWQNDLDAADLISLFGAAPVCVTGNTLATCKVKRPADNWRIKVLQEMDDGHCEGMAVTSFLFFEQRAFKNGRKTPANFQKDAESVFDLKFSYQSLQNYIAYFWATQTFPEVFKHKAAAEKSGPVGIVKTLISSMNVENGELYTVQICKYEGGKFKDCHAVAPIAVEDFGSYYSIHVYDNNEPGMTRYITVEKTGQQTWEYNAAPNPDVEEELYTGNLSTKSFNIVPLSSRLFGKKYRAPFATKRENNSESGNSSSSSAEKAEFVVNGDAEMLVTAGDGKRVGYDWNKKQTVNEIADAEINYLTTRSDDDLPPVIQLPYQPTAKPYTVTLSGKSLKSESRPDLVYTGPGFSVGFDGIKLDPNETLTFQISPDGEQLSFTASADGETPEIYFSFNGENGESYLVEVDGVELQAGKTLSAEFDSQTGKFHFKDNDGDEDLYDVDFERVLANGTEQSFETDNLDMGQADNYEMDFSRWDGKTPICFRDDDDGNGFVNDECEAQSNEDNDLDADDADDEGDDEDSDIDNDGKFNNVDDDDDGDGVVDDKDNDDDGDGEDDDGDGEGDEPQFLQSVSWFVR